MAAVNLEEIKKKYNFKQISVATWRNPNGSILPARGGPRSPLVLAEAAGTPFIPSYKVSYRLPEPTDDEASEDEEDAKSEKEGPVDSPLEATAPADPAGDHHDTPNPHDAEDPNENVEIIDESVDAIKHGDMGDEPSENVQETAQPPEAVPQPPEPVESLPPETKTTGSVPGDAVQDVSDLGDEEMEHTLDMPGSFDMLPPAAPTPPPMAPLGDCGDGSIDVPANLSLDMPDDLPESTNTDKSVHFAPGTPEPKPTSRKKKSSKGTKSKKRISVPIDSLPDDIVAIVDEAISSVPLPVLDALGGIDVVNAEPSNEPGELVPDLGDKTALDDGEAVAAEQAATIIDVTPEPPIEETSIVEPGPDVSGVVFEVLPSEPTEPPTTEVSKPKKKSSKSSGKDKDKSKKKSKVKDMIQSFEGIGTDVVPPPALPDLVIDVPPPPPPAVEAETVQESVEDSEGQEYLTSPAGPAAPEQEASPIVATESSLPDVEIDVTSDVPVPEYEPVDGDEQHATPEAAITSDIDPSALPIVEAAPEEVGTHEVDAQEDSIKAVVQGIDVEIVPDESDTLESSQKVTDDPVADSEGLITHDDGPNASNDGPVDDELQDSATTAHDPDAAEIADTPPPAPESVESTPTDESTPAQELDPSPAETVSIEDEDTADDETAVVSEESSTDLDIVAEESPTAESTPEEPDVEETSADKVEEPAVVDVYIADGPAADADGSHVEDDAAKHPEIETAVVEDAVIEEVAIEEAVVEAPKDESTEPMEAVSDPVSDETAVESRPAAEEPTEAPAESPSEDTGTAEHKDADLPSDIAEAEASFEATKASNPEPVTEESVEPPADAKDETQAVETPSAPESIPPEQPAETATIADAPAVQEETPLNSPPAPPSPTLSKGGSHKHKADRWERKHELKRTSTDIKPDKASSSKRSSRHSKEEPRSADRPHRSRRHTMPAEDEAERKKRREARKAEELARIMEEERRKADEEELRQIRHEARRAARKAAAEEAAKIAREEAEAVARDEAERRRKRREARDRKEEAARPPPRPRRESVTKAPLFIRTSGDQPRERRREETSHRGSRHSDRPSSKRGTSPTSKSSKDAGQSNDASSTPTEPAPASLTGSKSHRSHREAEDGERARSSRRESERHSRRPVVEEKPRSFFGSLLRRF
ncbi:hypothetical protein LTR56_005598 [Elasticomyces elasticus]|nr:hypothetical protein LTR56_005598 [Elasticomyces elasticus]KAK3664014.1 hypothetical protein LTR22_005234 [Elasticomyces elasticus]KAK4927338.1 hypothetical protein LTR49_005743 [Elasticomyces elasticus]KAK5763304.1 hypothetical protein LTS12_006479 [Elasticomyces elasticus]